MKITLSAILLLLLLVQVSYLPIMVLWLESNRDFIAQELCVNRDKPELMCQGSCHINQVVTAAMEEGPSGEMPLAYSKVQNIFSPFLPSSLFSLNSPFESFTPQPCYWVCASNKLLLQFIFRPPEVESFLGIKIMYLLY